jgi:hypothetical protein
MDQKPYTISIKPDTGCINVFLVFGQDRFIVRKIDLTDPETCQNKTQIKLAILRAVGEIREEYSKIIEGSKIINEAIDEVRKEGNL